MDFNIHNLVFHVKGQEPQKVEGKKTVALCCPPSVNFFEGLKRYNPDEREYKLFRQSFSPHQLRDETFKKMREGGSLQGEVDEAFERAGLLHNPEMQDYFLEGYKKEVLEDDMIKRFAKGQMQFEKIFAEMYSALLKERYLQLTTKKEILSENQYVIFWNDATISSQKEDLQRQGKFVFEVNNEIQEKILKGVLKIGVTKMEFDAFREKFVSSGEYSDLGRSVYFIRPPDVFDVEGFINEIFETAKSFSNPTLQNYFLHAVFDSVQRKSNDYWAATILKFNTRFNERFEEMQNAENEEKRKEIALPKNKVEHDNGQNKGLTTAQSVLTIFYLLKAAKFERGSNTTDIMFAQFVQSITGKEPNPKTKNTTILKRWREVVNERNALNPDDLEIVKAWFEKIGLTEIAEQIGKRKKKRKSNKE